MNRLNHKKFSAGRRAHRVRATIAGTASRPRLSVHVSTAHISAQVIDDTNGVTLASASSVGQKLNGTLIEKAAVIGAQIAESAKKAKVKKVVFDRGPKQFHGRVKVLADAARSAGMEF